MATQTISDLMDDNYGMPYLDSINYSFNYLVRSRSAHIILDGVYGYGHILMVVFRYAIGGRQNLTVVNDGPRPRCEFFYNCQFLSWDNKPSSNKFLLLISQLASVRLITGATLISVGVGILLLATLKACLAVSTPCIVTYASIST